jgi:hypothetical protein
MRLNNKYIVSLLLLFISCITHARERNDILSCYEYAKIKISESAHNSGENLLVVIDQTIDFDVNLKRSVHNKIHEFLSPGDRIQIATFAANADGYYSNLILDGRLDFSIPKDVGYQTSKPRLMKFEKCFLSQGKHVRELIDTKLVSVFTSSNTDVPKTEIMGSLKEISNVIPKDRQTTVLLVSDMLENSSFISFYRSGDLKRLQGSEWVASAKDFGLIADLDGANIYIIGGGVISSTAKKGSYRSAESMASIEKFWSTYFNEANAKLAGFGRPYLFKSLERHK